MEHFNLRKEVLERHIKKTGILHPVEEYNNLSEEEREISRKFWEGKKSLPREIDDFTHVVNQKEDDLDFLEEKLKKIESKEVEILKAEALVKKPKRKLMPIKMNFFQETRSIKRYNQKFLNFENN